MPFEIRTIGDPPREHRLYDAADVPANWKTYAGWMDVRPRRWVTTANAPVAFVRRPDSAFSCADIVHPTPTRTAAFALPLYDIEQTRTADAPRPRPRANRQPAPDDTAMLLDVFADFPPPKSLQWAR